MCILREDSCDSVVLKELGGVECTVFIVLKKNKTCYTPRLFASSEISGGGGGEQIITITVDHSVTVSQ